MAQLAQPHPQVDLPFLLFLIMENIIPPTIRTIKRVINIVPTFCVIQAIIWNTFYFAA